MARRPLLLTVLLFAACSGEPESPREPAASRPAGGQVHAKVGAIAVTVPAAWISKTPRSPMRKAEWALPGAGRAGEASLVVFHFGAAGGGVEENLERWKAQFREDPPGNATVTRSVQGSRPVTVLDIRGTYVAEMVPGSPERREEPGRRMLAAVVETKAGAHYFKLTGPAETVERWKDAFDRALASVRD